MESLPKIGQGFWRFRLSPDEGRRHPGLGTRLGWEEQGTRGGSRVSLCAEMLRQTKIVATTGPACRDRGELEKMIKAGMDVARLNFAHGTADEHAEMVENLRAAAEAVGREIGILQDVPGPKLRIGPVEGGTVRLHTGSDLVLTADQIEGNSERLSVAWPGLSEIMSPDDIAYLADGAIRLRVREVHDGEVLAEVEVGGDVASRQGLNLPNVTMSLPAVSEDDLRMINAGGGMGVDFIALSFIRRKEDLEPVRERLASRGADTPVFAKIEKPQAAPSAEESIEAAAGGRAARGDPGARVPRARRPLPR